MATKHQLCWRDHGPATMSLLSGLLDSGDMADVGLTGADGVTLPAHRLVLAASSPYFHRLFRDKSELRVAVAFKSTPQQVLKDMLHFMYTGEVKVSEEHRADFLKLANILETKVPSLHAESNSTQTSALVFDPETGEQKEKQSIPVDENKAPAGLLGIDPSAVFEETQSERI